MCIFTFYLCVLTLHRKTGNLIMTQSTSTSLSLLFLFKCLPLPVSHFLGHHELLVTPLDNEEDINMLQSEGVELLSSSPKRLFEY